MSCYAVVYIATTFVGSECNVSMLYAITMSSVCQSVCVGVSVCLLSRSHSLMIFTKI